MGKFTALRYGDSGERVLAVQHRLQALGYYIPEITGKIDDATSLAIISYQRASGIFPNNGQITEETWKMLKISKEV